MEGITCEAGILSKEKIRGQPVSRVEKKFCVVRCCESADFRLVDRNYLLPPSVDEWLPAEHLARFVVEIVDELYISSLEEAYTGSAFEACHPRLIPRSGLPG